MAAIQRVFKYYFCFDSTINATQLYQVPVTWDPVREAKTIKLSAQHFTDIPSRWEILIQNGIDEYINKGFLIILMFENGREPDAKLCVQYFCNTCRSTGGTRCITNNNDLLLRMISFYSQIWENGSNFQTGTQISRLEHFESRNGHKSFSGSHP